MKLILSRLLPSLCGAMLKNMFNLGMSVIGTISVDQKAPKKMQNTNIGRSKSPHDVR